MTVRNSYQIVKLFNSLCVCAFAWYWTRKGSELQRKEWINLKNRGEQFKLWNSPSHG